MTKPLFIFVVCLLITSDTMAEVPSDGLVGYWPFNGNADDESGQNNHGTASGASLAPDRFGNEDRAYSFDGNDRITIPADSSLDMTGTLSFSVWVKPEILSGTRMVFGKSNYSSATNYLLRVKSSGYIQWEYEGYTETDSDPLQLSTWHHLVVTASGPGLIKKIYIDDNLIAETATSSGAFATVTNPFTIGYASYNSEYFIGAIDDLRMYNRELSLPEIKALYEEPNPQVLIFADGFE